MGGGELKEGMFRAVTEREKTSRSCDSGRQQFLKYWQDKKEQLFDIEKSIPSPPSHAHLVRRAYQSKEMRFVEFVNTGLLLQGFRGGGNLGSIFYEDCFCILIASVIFIIYYLITIV